MSIYQYTTFDAFFRIWLSEELLLGEYKNMNDLYERQKFCGIDIGPQSGISKETRKQIGDPIAFVFKQISKFRQVSFCNDYKDGTKGCLSSMMWGQYAKNEKGVCIEFDKEKLLSGKAGYIPGDVSYDISVPFITISSSCFAKDPEKRIRSAIVDNKDKVFFVKHKHWEHENEFRIVSDTKPSISIKNAITCVYVQNPNSTDTLLLKKLIRKKVPVKYIDLVTDGDTVGLCIKELD